MKTASIRALRTQFPKVRKLLEEEGEVVVTERGRPVLVLRPFDGHARPRPKTFDYYGRLRRRMPRRLSDDALRELEDESRGER